jgi:3-isopropylmalate/(R)-2-methylmalate dehydratase small subunit
MRPIHRIESRIAVLPREDIDTDQIIPARYLKGTVKEGLGRFLFAGWRLDERGQVRGDFVLDRPESQGAQVLVAGANFGCGSSREHAPWALLDFGFRAVVSSSIADIFRGNAIKNGLLPVVVDAETHRALLASPGAPVAIDLEQCTLSFQGRSARFPIDPFARRCLLDGTDELGFLLARSDAIAAFETGAHEAEVPCTD